MKINYKNIYKWKELHRFGSKYNLIKGKYRALFPNYNLMKNHM